MIEKVRDLGLRCPHCESTRIAVVDTRGKGRMTRRRRTCRGCKRTFFTLEIAELLLPDSAELDALFERKPHVRT